MTTAKLWFADYDPYRTLFSLEWLFEPSLEKWPAYLITILVLAGALLVKRFWCRFLCPLGAIISIFQPIGLIKVRRDENLCINCGKCDKVCPSALKPSQKATPGMQCTSCLECVEACPVKGALDVYAGPKKDSLVSKESEQSAY
ncbi:MAG: 4Fe-4S binding protein [Firmicutes bacterium]|nr:4Fe-4S binding protein [Bacillota bacterium]